MNNQDRSLTPTAPFTVANLMDNFFDSSLERFFGLDAANGRRVASGSFPAVNIRETDTEYALEVAVPGMKKENFEIDVEDATLTISAETETSSEAEDDNYRRREFSYSSFRRSFSLPENVDEDKVSARYEDGLLRVVLPKLTPGPLETKRRKVDVR